VVCPQVPIGFAQSTPTQTTRRASSLSRNMVPLMTAFTSLLVVVVTMLSAQAVEPRTGLQVQRELQELPATPRELLVLLAMPHRLPLLQQVQVPPRLEKVRLQVPVQGKARLQVQVQGKAQLQVQGKVQAQAQRATQDRVVAKLVVVV
jgi:hypothetical protein